MAGEMWGLEKTIIGQAITRNSITELKEALDDGEDVAFQDRKGNTYLHYVCTMYRPYIFHILAGKEININAKNKHGNTALHVTALHREFGHVSDLLMYGADPFIRNQDGKTATEIEGKGEFWQTVYDKYQPGIFKVVDDHDVEKVKDLLHCWCRTDARRDGQTLRQYAAARKHHDIVQILDHQRHTSDAIFGVLEVDHSRVSKAINSGKCNINFLNKASEFKHILLHALKLKDNRMVQLVCKGGVDVNLPILLQNYLTAPMYFAAITPRLPVDVIWTVLKSNPNFLLKDQRGRNAVTFAMDKSNHEVPVDIIQYMMHNGVYLADRDETGITARDVARLARRQDVVKLLDRLYIKLLREEEMEKLEKLTQDGYDSMLITANHRDTYIYACGNETDTVVRFVQSLPDFQTRCRRIREAVKNQSVDAIAKQLEDYSKPYLLANCKDKGGQSLLHLCVMYWRTDVMRYLLSLRCINIDVQDNEEEREDFKTQLKDAGCDTQILDCQWLRGEDYEEHPEKCMDLEKEKNVVYGMDKQLLCVDKYEDLRRIIKNKRRSLSDFKIALRGFKQQVASFAALLSPVVDDYRDLIFVAVDCGQLEIAEYLAHLGADLTRKEQYLALDQDKAKHLPSSVTSTTVIQDLQRRTSEILGTDSKQAENTQADDDKEEFFSDHKSISDHKNVADHKSVYWSKGREDKEESFSDYKSISDHKSVSDHKSDSLSKTNDSETSFKGSSISNADDTNVKEKDDNLDSMNDGNEKETTGKVDGEEKVHGEETKDQETNLQVAENEEEFLGVQSSVMITIRPPSSAMQEDDDDAQPEQQQQQQQQQEQESPTEPAAEPKSDNGAFITEVPPEVQQEQQHHHEQQQQQTSDPNPETVQETENQEITECMDEAPLPRVEWLSVIERARRLGHDHLVQIFEKKLKYRRLKRMKKAAEKAPSTLGSTTRSSSKTPSSEKDEFSSDDEFSYSSDSSHAEKSCVEETESDSSAFDPVEDF